MSRSFPAFVIAFGILILDQATKHWANVSLTMGRPVEVIPGCFQLTLIGNSGAAWGMFKNQGIFLTILALGALVVLMLGRRYFTYSGWVPRVALGLLLGGITGNLVDRIRQGYVVDFLDFYWNQHHWPAFNIADSAICIGVGLYLIDSFRKEQSTSTPNPGASENRPQTH